MGRYEDYQNLIDMQILRGLRPVFILEAIWNEEEEYNYLPISYNQLKEQVDNGVVGYYKNYYNMEPLAIGLAPLNYMYLNTDANPNRYEAVFITSGGDGFVFGNEDPDAYLIDIT